jgi:hypothetical protein
LLCNDLEIVRLKRKTTQTLCTVLKKQLDSRGTTLEDALKLMKNVGSIDKITLDFEELNTLMKLQDCDYEKESLKEMWDTFPTDLYQ